MKLNLGCSDKHIEGYVNVDIVAPCDFGCDLNKNWPWGDSTIDHIEAIDIIEHLHNKIHTMNELWRVLKPGCDVSVIVPTTDGRGAFQDPTHVSWWNRNSFYYFEAGNPYRERFCTAYGIKAKFEILDEEEAPNKYNESKLRLILRAVK